MHGRGISSTIDYAISVNVPIGISDSYMFRNIYSDSICLYKNSIADCLKTNICSIYLDKYSNINILNKFKHILNYKV